MKLSNCGFVVKVGEKYLSFETHEITELHVEKKQVSIRYWQDDARGQLVVDFNDFEIISNQI